MTSCLPEGAGDYRGASFSPDGSELVFITGPEVDFVAMRQSP